MKYTVAFNGDMDLLPVYASYQVDSIFVKMTEDLTGGGRSAFLLPDIDLIKLEQIVIKCHQLGIKVNYVLNSACQSNLEYTKDYNAQLFQLMQDISDAGVDGVVVSSPFMLGFVKKNWPHLWTTVSVFAFVDNIEKAKFWDQQGADRLIFAMLTNRDFTLLKRMRKAISCEIELIANLACLYSCPIDRFHSCFVSHNSSTINKGSRSFIDYHIINCALRKMTDTTELIKARWIRPEDVAVYEEIGIDTLKITDRLKNSNWLTNAVKGYHDRSYTGNLMDLIHISLFRGGIDTNLADNPNRKELFDTSELSPELLEAFRSCKNVTVDIDSEKLNGFLDHFKTFDCSKANCGVDCKHCNKTAEEVITVNPDDLAHNVEMLSRVLNHIHDRSMFAEYSTEMSV